MGERTLDMSRNFGVCLLFLVFLVFLLQFPVTVRAGGSGGIASCKIEKLDAGFVRIRVFCFVFFFLFLKSFLAVYAVVIDKSCLFISACVLAPFTTKFALYITANCGARVSPG